MSIINPTSGLKAILAPKSIALIGASEDFSRIGGMIIKYLLKFGYKGHLYPVNPKYDEISGMKCYPSVRDLPEVANVALIAISGKFVIDTLSDCADLGIPTAVIYSAGFAETGADGKFKQDELRQVIKKTGMKVCGPNCIGIVNFINRVAMSFSGFLEADRLLPGNVGFVSQSGALGGSIVNRAQDRNIGFSYFVSTGNEAGLGLVDFLEFLVDDSGTQVIISYIEGIRDTDNFGRVASRALNRGKPIIVLKVGATDTGSKVAASHTGSMTGSDDAYSAAFKKYGVIRVDDYDDLIETALLFSKCKLSRGKRVGILTGTGGGAIILADKITKADLSLSKLSKNTKEALSQKVVSFSSVSNPLDLTGQLYSDPEMFKDIIKIFASDKNIDIVLVAISMVPGERARKRAEYIIDAAEQVGKPFVSWWAAGSLSNPGFNLLDQSKVTLFKSPDRCIKAIRSLITYSQFLDRRMTQKPEVRDRTQVLSDRNQTIAILSQVEQVITEFKAKQLLACYGIPIAREELAQSAEQAGDIAEKIGYPVVLKISSSQIPHKSEAGGIRLNLTNRSEVARAYHEILSSGHTYSTKTHIEGVVVQEMIIEGIEVMIGISKDPQFGAMIVFGMGGIFVEIMKDVSRRILPLTRFDAEEMVREIKGYEVLRGTRGMAAADLNSILDILLNISNLYVDLGDYIAEMDLNPVMVFEDGKGAKVLDALIIKEKDTPERF